MLTIEDLKNNKEIIFGNAADACEKAKRNYSDIKIIAVTKTHPVEYIYRAIEAGINCFGENYAQEIKDKFDEFNNSSKVMPEWHFIGHLQTNKVKYLAPYIDFIHSVDSFKLAEEISKQAIKNDREINILLQVNTSGEDSKSGCEPDEIINLVSQTIDLPNIKVIGLMTIGTFTEDEIQQRKEFSMLKMLLENVNKSLNLKLKELSMGMTGDYQIAIDEGSTMVRIGTAFFGTRLYKNK